jgi:hypothetical protein
MESDIVEVKEIVEKVDKRYEQKLSKRHKNIYRGCQKVWRFSYFLSSFSRFCRKAYIFFHEDSFNHYCAKFVFKIYVIMIYKI